MREIACRGCELVIRTHQTNRAYCSDECAMLTRAAKLGFCPICDTRAGLIVGPFALRLMIGDEFAAEHLACRRSAAVGRVHECRCNSCRRGRGDELKPRTARTENEQGRPRRTSAHLKHRDAVAERDRWVCQICLLPIEPAIDAYDDWAMTLDHVVQVVDGGGDEIENLRAAHRWCNDARNFSSDDATWVAARYRLGITE